MTMFTQYNHTSSYGCRDDTNVAPTKQMCNITSCVGAQGLLKVAALATTAAVNGH